MSMREVSAREEPPEAGKPGESLESIIEDRARAAIAAHKKLNQAADFVREIYRTLPGAIMVIGDNGLIEAVNGGAADLLEYTEAELTGKPAAIVFDPEHVPDFAEIEALADRNQILRTELDYCTKSDKTIPVLFSAAALGETDGSPLEARPRRIVCIAIDIRDRRRLELELRQAQKLESVGRLAAGVAHEINTPIQFVSDSIQFVRDAMGDLFALIEKLQRVHRAMTPDGPPLADASSLALAAAEEADLPYLLEHVPRALERSIDGLGRVATIVRSMKEFAHPDTRDMISTDLNRMIESTLTIAATEYKYVADVETDLGRIPRVTCHAGDVGQAILNIVVNAAHAIADVVGTSQERGRITVRTRQDGAFVVISIADTGGGIPEHVRDRIFDPFFTTKAIGRGTGQGLAIARSVVADKHGGELTYETDVGRGTTFFLRFPIEGPPEPPRG